MSSRPGFAREAGTIKATPRFCSDREPTHEQRLPASPEIRPETETAPIELDDDLTRRDAWMFTPLLAIMIALPIMASALFAFSAWHTANRDEASSGPADDIRDALAGAVVPGAALNPAL